MKSGIIITGIICIAGLEAMALYKGINGTIFVLVVAVLAGAIGVTVPTPKWMGERLRWQPHTKN